MNILIFPYLLLENDRYGFFVSFAHFVRIKNLSQGQKHVWLLRVQMLSYHYRLEPDGKGIEKMEVAISEKELKLLLNFVKDNLEEARETKDEENRNRRIDRTLEHIQQYLED